MLYTNKYISSLKLNVRLCYELANGMSTNERTPKQQQQQTKSFLINRKGNAHVLDFYDLRPRAYCTYWLLNGGVGLLL